MAKNATVSMEVDSQLKADAESVFHQLGLTTNEAIKIFFTAVRNRKGLPFQLQLESDQVLAQQQRKNALNAIVGAYPLITSSNEFACLKQKEIALEERKLKR
ncbi:MAG: type II toxin-antitoxin system RelB/DinJ family antitoxin [Trichlorobacter sp.]|jgi:DNA-damage-inducible protein J|nr:type II toxin-antitoxin system RelB/DinJ family antitoxin [Trichlorobacter sp.]